MHFKPTLSIVRFEKEFLSNNRKKTRYKGLRMTRNILEINIANLESWLVSSPNDEDYKRILNEFQKELEELNSEK